MEARKPNVALAGLGAMGFGIATNLLKHGFPVTGYDVYQPAMDRFVAEGGKSASTPREAAEDVEFFVCMVVNAKQASDALYDMHTGACCTLPKKATVLMCSTVAPGDFDGFKEELVRAGRRDVRLTVPCLEAQVEQPMAHCQSLPPAKTNPLTMQASSLSA